MAELIGYQAREEWMGNEVLTLADIWPAEPRAMIVGLNLAPSSVTAGNYYQGQVGQGQLRKLASVGLFGNPRGRFFEDAALSAGVGFTDIVKRPTRSEGDVGTDEIRFGSSRLADKLSRGRRRPDRLRVPPSCEGGARKRRSTRNASEPHVLGCPSVSDAGAIREA